ncbi:hypothetical protein ALC56_06679 [Trachymyrmex septentrionalis]|uniref:Integrase zinc-binding domain-containing protein n=1 Tax=Trachymyrmex septentrionalis TaxID=34720 RepID=A0A151JWN6_9HYME|nr:hypothetical protein ALC56_06679 [Trachymyrmex septentrionalis]
MTRDFCERLSLPQRRNSTRICGNVQITALTEIHATIQSKFNAFRIKLAFSILPEITVNLPLSEINKKNLQIETITLADPSLHTPEKRDILLGSSIFWETIVLCIGQIKLGEESQTSIYLPHHAVLKPDSITTKLRVVFDASCPTSSGVSLNNIFRSGPTIQQNLFSVTMRFRQHRFVITADIKQMYRQVLVQEDQGDLQRIVVASASFLTIRCIFDGSCEVQELPRSNEIKMLGICWNTTDDGFCDASEAAYKLYQLSLIVMGPPWLTKDHLKHMHMGLQDFLAHLRGRYWPLTGRQTIRRVLRKCIACFRVRPSEKSQLMEDLPRERVTPSSIYKKDKDLPFLRWHTSRIIETHPGSDGYVSVIIVRTSNGVTNSAINKICVLPIET